MPIDIKESTGVKFSLSFLLQILGTVIIAVWGYSQLDARLNELQHSSKANIESITRIELSMADNQDKPIPSDHIQNTKLYSLEREMQQIREAIGVLETRIYNSNSKK